MHLKLLPYLLLSAASAVVVTASPIRIVVVSSSVETIPNVRFGAAVPYVPGSAGTNHHNHYTTTPAASAGGGRRGCRFREKAIAISNAFRGTLGMPLIHAEETPGAGHSAASAASLPHPRPHHAHPGHAHPGHQYPQAGYTHKWHLNDALVALGPWEGRAVAFVLGCGIGVLLRMLWVLSVISYRAIRGQTEETIEYTPILVEDYYVAEESAPTYQKDEKAPLEESGDKKPDSNN